MTTSTANNIRVLPYSEAGALPLTLTWAWLFGTAWSCPELRGGGWSCAL